MTPNQVRALRARNNWSLQDLANHSGINKAYLSEFENNKRKLTEEQLQTITDAFERHQPAGRARPELRVENGHWRLVFLDANGKVYAKPPTAHITWTEEGGTTYSMFVGDPDL